MTRWDYYQVLGVSPGAGWSEIRRGYRALALKYHPDRNPDDPQAAAQFRRLVEAYEALREEVGARVRRAAGGRNYRQPRFTDTEDFFAEYFGIPGRHLQQSAGPDFRYDLQIPFAAAILGLETVIAVDRTLNCPQCQGTGLAPDSYYQDCPDCRGQGRRFRGPGLLRYGPLCPRCRGQGCIISRACAACAGAGQQRQTRNYRIIIPPGIKDGSRLRFLGQGGKGFRDGPPGNLEVVITVAPHDFFRRVGNDLFCRLQVSFAQAALGGMIRIPTLEGFQTLELPRGTQSGKVFRLRGAGVRGEPRQRRGDQVVEIVVTTPEDLNPGQMEILEELARLEREQPTVAVHE